MDSWVANEFDRVVRLLTIEAWAGKPIPMHIDVDGVSRNVGSRVRFRSQTLGYIWPAADVANSNAALCWRIVDHDAVTRSGADTAAVAYTLALAWAARNDLDGSYFNGS